MFPYIILKQYNYGEQDNELCDIKLLITPVKERMLRIKNLTTISLSFDFIMKHLDVTQIPVPKYHHGCWSLLQLPKSMIIHSIV